MNILEHIERYLGKIQEIESTSHDHYGNLAFLSFEDKPYNDIITYVTLGLSTHTLKGLNNKEYKFEFLCSINKSFDKEETVDALFYASVKLLDMHIPILRGDIIYLPNDIYSNNKIKGFYASLPIFFDEDFWVYENNSVIFIWLVPITNEEITYIEANGWSNFEELLENSTCELWNINRKSII